MRDSNLQMQDVFADFFFDRELGVCSVIAFSNCKREIKECIRQHRKFSKMQILSGLD